MDKQSNTPLREIEVAQQEGQENERRGPNGRAGYRSGGAFLRTIPSNITQVRSRSDPAGKTFEVLSNFVALNIPKVEQYFQYRLEFEPNIEAKSLRRRVFDQAFESVFHKQCLFDGMSDCHSSIEMEQKEETRNTIYGEQEFKLTIKQVGVTSSAPTELIRVYNNGSKRLLRALKFFQVSQTGAYVHADFTTAIGQRNEMIMVRGFKTSAQVYEQNRILVNLEPVHKIMQRDNVLRLMTHIREGQRGGNLREEVRSALTGKLVVTSYRKVVYRIEDVDFDKTPMSTFRDEKRERDVKYVDYFKDAYHVTIQNMTQPLLLVVPNSRRKSQEEGKDIYLIPELCNIAGLTEEQRVDNRLKMDLIRASQIAPDERVAHMRNFLHKVHNEPDAKLVCERLGYGYEREPIKIQAKIVPAVRVGLGQGAINSNPQSWPQVAFDGDFENIVKDSKAADIPEIPKLAIIISRPDAGNEAEVLGKIKMGFQKVGIRLADRALGVFRMTEGDAASHYVQYLSKLPPDTTAALVVLTRQNKERYDAVKKFAAVERGLVTQVVTSKLMMDPRKASGAAIKIGVQVAAKVGGSPWYVHFPLQDSMVCGYDTYHDTTNRGRSFGAFVASMNKRFSRWYSKADAHDQLSELSRQMASDMTQSLKKYHELNNKTYPRRVFIYRDGVSEGQIQHVFEVELKQVKRAMTELDPEICLTYIIVNKRVGARFYQSNGRGGWTNCATGTVIDDHVTRNDRYDFYLISQHTRQGTVTPTYYNIIHDESGLTPSQHQMMAHKMTHIYYNWTGPVRVPAPCQYAHKLALLCGEHLHATPNAALDDRLHFL